MLGHSGPQRLGDVGHRIKIADAAHIEPVHQLGDAHLHLARRHADGGKLFGKARTAEAHQRGLVVGCAQRFGRLKLGDLFEGLDRAHGRQIAEFMPHVMPAGSVKTIASAAAIA